MKKKLLLLLSILMLSNYAFAGAWLRKKGESELISKYEYSRYSDYYTDPGNNQRYLSKTFFFELYSILYQYGVNEKVTLGLEEKWFNYLDYNSYYTSNSSSYETFEQNEFALDGHYKKFENNPYSTKLYLQTPLWSSDSSILSFRPAFESYNNDLDQTFEIAALYGYNFRLGKEYSYLNVEYGIARNPDDITAKMEVTLGLTVHENHTALIQLFSYQNVGILRDQDIDIGQFSWQIKYNDTLSFQTGYSTNISRRKEFITDSIITGLIIKF